MEHWAKRVSCLLNLNMKRIHFHIVLWGIVFFVGAVVAVSLPQSADSTHIAITPADKKDEWWVRRHAENVELMNNGDIDLLMIGDSITHGWDENYWNMYYAHRKPINLGFSGDRTEHVLWRLDNLPLDKISPKAAMLMIGTNNIGHNSTNPKETAEGIKAIVNRLQKAFPEMQILVLHVFPRDNKPDGELRKKIEEINFYLPDLLKDEKNVTLLDINSKFLEADGTLAPEIMPDFLHPKATGYGIWARTVDPVLSRLLDETNPATEPADRLGDQWWRTRQAENAARIDKGNVGLLMIGDSITHGWEGQKELWDETFGKHQPVNLGFGGDQTQHVLWRLDRLPLDKISPRTAQMMIGTNNIGNPNNKNTPYQVAIGIRAIVEKLQTQYPDIPILVLNVFPRDEASNDLRRLKVNEINACLPIVLDGLKNVRIVDFGEKFLAPDGTLPKELMPDFLHLSPDGYKIWADSISPELEK